MNLHKEIQDIKFQRDQFLKSFSTSNISKNDIVNEFYDKEVYLFVKKINKWKTKFNPENYKSKNFSEEIVDAKTQKVIVKLGEKINFLTAKKLFNDGLKEIYVSSNSLYGKYLQKDYSYFKKNLGRSVSNSNEF